MPSYTMVAPVEARPLLSPVSVTVPGPIFSKVPVPVLARLRIDGAAVEIDVPPVTVRVPVPLMMPVRSARRLPRMNSGGGEVERAHVQQCRGAAGVRAERTGRRIPWRRRRRWRRD